MDVMGGIADYSGALVLQLPIAEACHVALQRGRGAAQQDQPAPAALISVVSFHADSDHRSPVFSALLSDLFPGGQPMEYADARAFFKVSWGSFGGLECIYPQARAAVCTHTLNAPFLCCTSCRLLLYPECLSSASQTDAATSWAGYVAGCLLVLAREEGQSLAALLGGDSVAIIVSSEVPEGKGVSSSAAVEVAVMMAMLEAFDLQVGKVYLRRWSLWGSGKSTNHPFLPSPLQVDGRRLAILCQKVENLVVGAPCGIMDQVGAEGAGGDGAVKP